MTSYRIREKNEEGGKNKNIDFYGGADIPAFEVWLVSNADTYCTLGRAQYRQGVYYA